MPPGWIHQTLDLIVFGNTYAKVHKWKDERAGKQHRLRRHKWYNEFGKTWDFENPFPTGLIRQSRRFLTKVGPALAEARQADIQHDYWDRTWDTLNRDERENVAALLFYWVMDPDLLKRKAGVDVIGEKVKRRIHGRDAWEHTPGLNEKYTRLRQSIWQWLGVKGRIDS